MGRSFAGAAALVITGMTLGLGLGAWVWREGAGPGRQGRQAVVPNPPGPRVPAGPAGPAGVATAAGGNAGTAGTKADRVAELAKAFRRIKEARDEAPLRHIEAVMGLAGLTSEDFARLMSRLEEDGVDVEGVDVEVAVVPLFRWAVVDPNAALAFASSSKQFKSTEKIIAPIVKELAKVDLPAAKAALDQLEPEERRYSQRAIVRLLQENDPLAALEYAREVHDLEAENDVFKFWAGTDPAGAAAALGQGRGDQGSAIAAIAASLAKQDRAAFEEWSAGLTDPVARTAARQAGLEVGAAVDPAKAAAETAAWLATEPAVGERLGDLPRHIVQRWWEAKASPQDVAAWAESLPAGPASDTALGEVGHWWVERDAAAASAWLGTLPAGPGRDQAVHELTRKVGKDAPDEAFEWARTIHDYSVRTDSLHATVRTWAVKDPVAARAAVAALPPEQRGNLVEVIEEAQVGTK